MTANQPHPPEEFYWLTKSQLDELLLDLEYQRYNLARRTEEAIRSQKYIPASARPAQERIPITDAEIVLCLSRVENLNCKSCGEEQENSCNQGNYCLKSINLIRALLQEGQRK